MKTFSQWFVYISDLENYWFELDGENDDEITMCIHEQFFTQKPPIVTKESEQ